MKHPWALVALALLWLTPGLAWSQGQLFNSNITLAGTLNAGLATGSVNAYVLTLNPPITAYTPRQCFTFQANSTNTSIATLNINGLGAKTLKKFVGAVMSDLSASDIGNGQPILTCYDGTYMQLVGAGGGGGGGGGGSGMTPFGQANAAAFGMATFGGL